MDTIKIAEYGNHFADFDGAVINRIRSAFMKNRIVETKKGKIAGISQGGCVFFKGIPYAKPPVGELRWKPPAETEPWEDTFEADTFPNRCMQLPQSNEFYLKEFYQNADFEVNTSEDCLYLNIWVPENAKEEKLPVAVYIHGGAFLGGHCSELEFDGAGYCKRDVILVSINYRCNVFGFLAHPWLSAESECGISGNYGILDQIAALKWIQENIGAFGGDAENITIFGQSAGSMSVQTLVSSELTQGLIHKAILQSAGSYGGGLNKDVFLQEAMEKGEKIAEAAGVKTAEELRSLSSEAALALVEKSFELFSMSEGLTFIPNIDGYVLKDGYDKLVDEDKIHKISYMIGSTENDLTCLEEDIAKGIKSSLYHGCISWSLKNEENGNVPSYVYYFKRKLPGDDAGAFHSAELWYIFETLKRCWRPMTKHDYALAEKMITCWANFMKNGNPNGQENEWRLCTKEDSFVMEFE
jgi:Carboxylesterase type B